MDKVIGGSKKLGGSARLPVHRRMAKSTRMHAATNAEQPSGEKLEGTAALVKVLPAVVTALLGAFMFGYHLGVVNGALDYIAVELGIVGNTAVQGLIVSITLAGATLGSLLGGSLSDQYGRCKSLVMSSIPMLAGAAMCALATSTNVLVLGRLLCGVGIGLSSCVVPVYISEVAPAAVRGALGSFNQLSICFGILGALIAGLPLAGNAEWWRTMFWMAAVPAGLLGAFSLVIPESPRWLAKQGDTAKALEAGRRLWGACSLADVKGADEAEGASEASEVSWGDLLLPKYLKPVMLGFFLFMFQQMAGINAVIYFSSNVFRSAGVTSDVLASAGVGLVNVLATITASSVIDRLGRKPLLITSFTGMAASMLLLAAALSWPALAAYKATLCVFGTMSYILAFGLGVGPVPSLLVSEIMSSRIRGKGASVAMMSHWSFNFIIGQAFLEANRMFGVSTIYVFFASVCLIAVVFVQTNVLETKGKSLEEIEKAFAT